MSCEASHILYALDNNYIPVVDMKNCYSQYFKDNRNFKDNVWEYYFEQPTEYNLENIEPDAEIIISENSFFADDKHKLTCKDLPINSFNAKYKYVDNLKNRYKDCFKLNKETQKYIENEVSKYIKNDDVVIGVLARGTDYLKRKTKGEHIQPQPRVIINKLKHFLKKHKEITKIYLATEDDEIYQTFKKEFKDMVIDNNQYRYKYTDNQKYLCELNANRENHKYTLGLEYLSSLHILSRCQYFIGGRCAGTKIAWILSEGWKDMYIWDLGVYGQNNFQRKLFCLNNEYDRDTDQKIKNITLFGITIKFRIG